MDAPVVDSVPLLLMVPLPPRIDAARALLPDVDTVPVLIDTLLGCPMPVCTHAAVIPNALGPAVVIEPLLRSVLPLPLAAMPSLKAPVVLIVAPCGIGERIAVAVGQHRNAAVNSPGASATAQR